MKQRKQHTVKVQVGDVYHGAEIVKVIPPTFHYRVWFKCRVCKKVKEAFLTNVISGRTTTCGCDRSGAMKRWWEKRRKQNKA